MKNIKWLTSAVPALVFVVAAIQYYNVQQGLTRWKGGGFGMYSEISFQKNEIWVSTQDSFLLVEDLLPNWQHYSKTIGDVKRFPTQETLEKLYRVIWKLDPEQTYVIEVWRPKMNMKNLNYEKSLIYEYASNN